MKTKVCKICGIEKDLSDFYKDKVGKFGVMSICKKCKNNKLFKWRKNNSEKFSALKLKKYGITLEYYNKMLETQNNACAICGKEETTIGNKQTQKFRKLAVDHNHITGKVRGLLCRKCNQAIGLLNENIDSFYSAIKYLLSNK